MIKARFLAVISSFLVLTGCGSYSEDSSAVTVQSNSSVASVLSTQSKSADTQPQNEKKADSMQIVIEE